LNPIRFFDGCHLGYVSSGDKPVGVSHRECKSLVVLTWAAVVCPEYGVAFAGFTQSFADQLTQACFAAGCSPTWPWQYYNVGVNLIVEDGTPFAIDTFDEVGVEEVTGEFEDANDYYVSNDQAVSSPVPEYVPGLEVVVVQVSSAFGGGNFSVLTYDDAINILTDQTLQQSVTSYVYGGLNWYNDELYGFCPYGYWLSPSFAGTPGVIIQIQGEVYGSAEYVAAWTRWYSWGGADGWEITIGDWTYVGEGQALVDQPPFTLEADKWHTFTAIVWSGTDGYNFNQVQVSNDAGGYLGDVDHGGAPLRTTSTAQIVPPGPCLVEGRGKDD